MDRTDPRWADLTVAGYAMGGAFLSRLNKVLREERGYTYGVRLGFSPHRSAARYAVQGSFRTEVLVDAVREARELLDVATRPFEPRGGGRRGRLPRRHVTRCGSPPRTVWPIRPPARCWAGCRGLPRHQPRRAARGDPRLGHGRVHAAWSTPATASLVVVGAADQLAEPLRALGYDELVVTEG